MSDQELERRLRDLGDGLDVPTAPGLPHAVRRRIAGGVHRAARPAGRRRGVAAAAAAAVLVLGGAALANLLIPGVEIRRVPDAPTASAPGSVEELRLGRSVDLAEARRVVDLTVLVPQRLGRPDAVYVGRNPAGGRVTMVYEPTGSLPRDPNTGAGMLVTLFRGSTDAGFVRKRVGPATTIRNLEVEGDPGMWIEGAPHTVGYIDEAGELFHDSLRLAGNVLIWQEGSVTVRLESRLDLEPSLRVAESMA
jgi:hypothetical protein